MIRTVKKLPLQIKPSSNLVVVIADSYLDMNIYIEGREFPMPISEEEKDRTELEGYAYPCSKEGNYYIIINLRTTVGYIAHEVRHVLNYIYQDIGYTLDIVNDELDCSIMTYYVDYIYDLQVKELTKRNKEDAKAV